MALLRQRWSQILLAGIVLFVLTYVTQRFTDNVDFFPTVMLLGSFLVPTAFVAYFYQQEAAFDREHHDSILPTLMTAALVGGLIGTLTAGVLEYATLTSNSVLSTAWVGPIEQLAKLVIPVAIYFTMRNRFRTELDGLLCGVAAGMSFAALETMGYSLVTLINSQGSLNAVNETMLIRGVLSPAGHASWAGIITATLWRERQRVGRAFTPMTLAIFLVFACLHSLWGLVSSVDNMALIIPSYFAISAVSLGLLISRLRESRRRLAPEAVVAS